jgi:hypothetical protein
VSDPAADHLEIHASLGEELRHSDGLVWQFAIAIIALEDGAVVLSEQSGFQSPVGKSALAAAFLVSVCLSFVFLRHAQDRRGFVRRMEAVEEELRNVHPRLFAKNPGSPQWFASMLLAWVLLAESTVGFIFFLWHLYA